MKRRSVDWFGIVAGTVFMVVIGVWWFEGFSVGGLELMNTSSQAQESGMTIAEQRESNRVYANSVVARYERVKRIGSPRDACIEAEAVVAALLTVQDAARLPTWRDIEERDCAHPRARR